VTGPVSQFPLPAAAAAASDVIRPDDEDLNATSHDSDGVPVGEADVEADARRAGADAE
jgi:hypothetical protein